jgi:hypothetical protein
MEHVVLDIICWLCRYRACCRYRAYCSILLQMTMLVMMLMMMKTVQLQLWLRQRGQSESNIAALAPSKPDDDLYSTSAHN